MTIDNKRLVVLGAGWLGEALCQSLSQKGYTVEGTRQSNLNEYSWQKTLFLENGKLNHTLSLENAYWVCAIPPRARHADSNYLTVLEETLKLSKKMLAKGFLLCSSTGVYAQSEGIYDERGRLDDSDTLRCRLLQEAEALVRLNQGKIVRLAGLVGPEREPGKFVSGKTLKSGALDPVNMVHRHDVINAIETILSQWQQANEIYNLCYPEHPSRADYYHQHCKNLGTVPPEFLHQNSNQRVINGNKILELGFKYQYAI